MSAILRIPCSLAVIYAATWRLGHRSDGTYVLAHLATRKQWTPTVCRNALLVLPCRIASCKKRTQPQLGCDCAFFEIRQLAILPDLGWSSTFAVDELNFCVRNGNRWILVAIITGMAPLVGLEAEGDFEKGLKMSLLCAKTA